MDNYKKNSLTLIGAVSLGWKHGMAQRIAIF